MLSAGPDRSEASPWVCREHNLTEKTPYEAVTRLWIVPYSLTRMVFPIFAADAGTRQRTRVYKNAVEYLALILAPVVAATIIFAPDLLRLWVGEPFARSSTLALQILATGVLVNSMTQVSFTLVESLGRLDITAKVHLLESPFYLFLLWYAVQHWGIAGAAIARAIRVSADGILLAFCARSNRFVNRSPASAQLLRTMMLASIITLGAWAGSKLAVTPAIKVIVWGLVLTALARAVWLNVLNLDEQERLTGFVRSLANRATSSARHRETRE